MFFNTGQFSTSGNGEGPQVFAMFWAFILLIGMVYAMRRAGQAWGWRGVLGTLFGNFALFCCIGLQSISDGWGTVGVLVGFFIGPLLFSAQVSRVAQRVLFARIAEEVVVPSESLVSTFN